jgi:predicted GH43/DUF377 family glycosyl hydrolase
MAWVKKGLIYQPSNEFGWNKSHAQLICADTSYETFIRVYYSTRDEQGRSTPLFMDLDKNNLSNIIYKHSEPILPLGNPGLFDDCGVMPTWIMNNNGEKWLYYIGWTVRNTIPYHNSIGLATSKDGIHFTKMFEGPVLNTIATEPYFNGTACVLFDEGIYKIWYLSCTGWHQPKEGKLEPCYNIKYAESNDGIHWNRQGIVAIDFEHFDEGGISKANVIKYSDHYKMWYSYRCKDDYRDNTERSYRIGYAESKDGIRWTRMDDKVGIDISDSGWDSQMVEYPMVFDNNGTLTMIYNGNGFGQSGFGYAVYED